MTKMEKIQVTRRSIVQGAGMFVFSIGMPIGLDTMLSVAEVTFEAFGEPRFKAPSLLRQLVTAGRLGRKSGSGFYRWEGDKRMEALPL